jgi:hypothetical protein
MNNLTIDLDNLPEIRGYDREAQKSIVKYLTTGEADMWEFWDDPKQEKKTGNLTHATECEYRRDNTEWHNHARPVKPFDTRQGRLTDADSMNGNTPDRRPFIWLKREQNRPILRMYGRSDDYVLTNNGRWRYEDIRLATPSEVAAAGYPREWAGLREGKE